MTDQIIQQSASGPNTFDTHGRAGAPGRMRLLPGRWPEAPPWTGVDGGFIYTWDELQSWVPR